MLNEGRINCVELRGKHLLKGFTVLAACCAVLTELSLDDASAHQIVQVEKNLTPELQQSMQIK